jgi:glucose/arabinose dehydrogenase
MSRRASAMLAVLLAVGLGACADWASVPLSAGTGPNPALPPPAQRWFPTVNIAPAVGWMPGAVPQPAPGLRVNAFARDLDHPRWLLVLPNGDVLVAESNAPARTDRSAGIRQWLSGLMMKIAGAGVPSANRITLLRDTDHDGVADLRTVLLEGLNSPFGMALVEDQLYVANTDAVLRFPYVTGQTRIELPGVKLADLPAGPINHHWTKNLIVDPAGDQLYVTVGSNSNVAERGMALEEQRAAIWAIDRRSGRHRIFASGLRNPNGLAWEPQTRTLWTVVNERDELGSDLVPDYLTSVRDGDSFGWPHTYFGSHVDVRVTSPPPAGQAAARVPDYALGAHTAPLGLAWSAHSTLLPNFGQGMFIGQHGSWNRRPHSGYNVVFVPFEAGRPSSAPPLEVLTGFLTDGGRAQGRPVGVAIDARGALLVADDVGNVIWRVSPDERR